MRRSPRVLALFALSLALLVGGSTAFVRLDKTVTVSVDGKTRSVRTFARTVGGVLDRAGIPVGRHDSVAPSRSTAARDGALVSVRRGRLLTLTVDGATRRVWVQATSVAEALDQLGLRATDAFLSASRSRRIPLGGMDLTLRTPQRISILADGRATPLLTTAATVGEALAQARITVGRTDKVSVPVSVYPTAGLVVRVTRIRAATEVATRPIAATTLRRTSATLYRGRTAIADAGAAGVLRQVYALTYVDGRLASRRLTAQQVIAPARARIVLVGSKPLPVAASTPTYTPLSGSVGSSGGLNWAALARCESGGNPRAVNSTGTYRGLYQFSIGTWQSVGGSGDPINASASEQTYRAQLLYNRSGRSPWPVCGRYL